MSTLFSFCSIIDEQFNLNLLAGYFLFI